MLSDTRVSRARQRGRGLTNPSRRERAPSPHQEAARLPRGGLRAPLLSRRAYAPAPYPLRPTVQHPAPGRPRSQRPGGAASLSSHPSVAWGFLGLAACMKFSETEGGQRARVSRKCEIMRPVQPDRKHQYGDSIKQRHHRRGAIFSSRTFSPSRYSFTWRRPSGSTRLTFR